ncbi:MAG: hypothetical protein Ct9H90mP6_04710 [Gammaproteobacteria bacterium]|nr:MAG: hypothetical protein Ct9H90mP6_04710 [Gammaproteobacteria bacterium]
MKALHQLVTFLDVCDGDMSQGFLRCDANVSIRKVGDAELGTRTEIKNINSFRFIEKAINFEIKRQIKVLERVKKLPKKQGFMIGKRVKQGRCDQKSLRMTTDIS